jgi:Domain of unknown function (DUF1899)
VGLVNAESEVLVNEGCSRRKSRRIHGRLHHGAKAYVFAFQAIACLCHPLTVPALHGDSDSLLSGALATSGRNQHSQIPNISYCATTAVTYTLAHSYFRNHIYFYVTTCLGLLDHPNIGEQLSEQLKNCYSSDDRHVFGQPAKKEHCLENVKVSSSAWDTNLVAASGVSVPF